MYRCVGNDLRGSNPEAVELFVDFLQRQERGRSKGLMRLGLVAAVYCHTPHSSDPVDVRASRALADPEPSSVLAACIPQLSPNLNSRSSLHVSSSLPPPLDPARAIAVLVSCLCGRRQCGARSGHFLTTSLGIFVFRAGCTTRFFGYSAHLRRSPCTVVQMTMTGQQ